MLERTRILVLLAAGQVVGTNAFAIGGSQPGSSPVHFTPEEIAAFAKQVETTVAAKGARVFIIARQGRPAEELPEGIHYTHTGFGVYSSITMEDGSVVPGYALYNLYQRNDEPEVSDLVVDYPVNFFAGVYELRAGIIIPSPELQRRLLDVISSDTYATLHNRRYSVISNPFNSQYQNCTEHTLDVINAAIYQTGDIEQLKRNAEAYYRPQEVNVDPFKLMIGSLFMAELTVSDHPGAVATSTFTTIQEYLQSYDLVDTVLTITPHTGP